MVDQLSSQIQTEVHSDKVLIIEAECVNCNKRFSSMRGVSMHMKATAGGHSVIFINHGNYDKRTGLRRQNMDI